MVDISVEILATSVPIIKENLRYKVKTWWAHVDMDSPKKVNLPNLPMIEHYYNMNGKETTIFVEMWYRNVDLFPVGAMRFLGMAKYPIDEQLKNPDRNPWLEWLEVYDPIEDIVRGRLLLKIDAKFNPPEGTPRESCKNSSSYFSRVPQSVSSTNAKSEPSPSLTNVTDFASPVKSLRSVPVQTEGSGFPYSESEIECLAGRPLPTNQKKSLRYSESQSAKFPDTRESIGLNTRFHYGNTDVVTQRDRGLSEQSPPHCNFLGKLGTVMSEGKGKSIGSHKVKLPQPIFNKESDKIHLKEKKALVIEPDDSVDAVIHLLNDDFDLALNDKKTSKNNVNQHQLGRGKVISEHYSLTESKELQLHFQNKMEEQMKTKCSRSPAKRLAPEGQKDNEANDCKLGSQQICDKTLFGIGIKITPLSKSKSYIRPRSSTPTPPGTTTSNSKRPSISRRCAAAIFNNVDYE